MVLLEAVKERFTQEFPTLEYELKDKKCHFYLNGLEIFSCKFIDPLSIPPERVKYFFHKLSPAMFFEDYDKLKEMLYAL